MRLNNQNMVKEILQQLKATFKEALKASLIYGILIIIILWGLYYSLLSNLIKTNSISFFLFLTQFNAFITFMIIVVILFFGFVTLVLELFIKSFKEPEINNISPQDIEKFKKYIQLIKNYFGLQGKIWKIIGIIIVVYYGYIFANIYQILKGSSLIK
jgi:ABC-type multidrug transport system permease subunit